MTDRLTSEEREALIARDVRGSVTPGVAADIATLCRLLADPSTWAEPSAGLGDAVVRAVTDAAPVAVAPVRPVSAATPPLPPTGARRHRRRVPSAVAAAVAVAVAVAASVLIALVAGIVVGHREVDPNFKADLTATALAPGARASAEMYHTEAGFRVSLEAHGLPNLPPGEYYQAWLRNAQGSLVPIGTFSSSDGHITLWSGVSPNDFPTLTVTIEATDNDRAPMGRRVLAGDTHAA
jgi:Anti-sigma-K factor rskA